MIEVLIIMADVHRWLRMHTKLVNVPGVVVTHEKRMQHDIAGRTIGVILIDETAGLTPEEAKQMDPLRLWTGGVK